MTPLDGMVFLQRNFTMCIILHLQICDSHFNCEWWYVTYISSQLQRSQTIQKGVTYTKTNKIHISASIKKVNVKWSRYRPGVAQRVGRGIALLFHDRSTRRWWVVSSTPWPHFTPGKDPVPILQEAGCVPGSVWTGGKSRPHRDSIPDRPAHGQSLYRLSYTTAHFQHMYTSIMSRNTQYKLQACLWFDYATDKTYNVHPVQH